MEFLFAIIVLILSIVIHELAHGYAALAQGDPTAKYAGRLTMNPIKHLDLVGSFIVPLSLYILSAGFILGWAKPVPYNPYNLNNQRWGEALVAVAGPAANIVVAVLFGLLIRFGGGFLSQDALLLAGLIVIINIVIALFNLLPIPPLDGSKVLFDLLPRSVKVSEMRLFLERYGLLVILVVVIFAGGIIFPAISVILVFVFELLSGDVSLIGEVINRFLSQ
ncbi:MAG: site-2 protease family protein [Candidatus Paceibacterota bacterium]